MKTTLATMAAEMRPDEKAVLKVGRIPARHMAAIMANGTELKSGAKRVLKPKASTTTASAKVPLTESQHKAAVEKTKVESIVAARARETEQRRVKEIEQARALGDELVENEKRKKAFAPIRSAMDAAAIKPEPKAKVKGKRESESDKQARAAYRKYAAMTDAKERSAFWNKNRALIMRGMQLEQGNNK